MREASALTRRKASRVALFHAGPAGGSFQIFLTIRRAIAAAPRPSSCAQARRSSRLCRSSQSFTRKHFRVLFRWSRRWRAWSRSRRRSSRRGGFAHCVVCWAVHEHLSRFAHPIKVGADHQRWGQMSVPGRLRGTSPGGAGKGWQRRFRFQPITITSNVPAANVIEPLSGVSATSKPVSVFSLTDTAHD